MKRLFLMIAVGVLLAPIPAEARDSRLGFVPTQQGQDQPAKKGQDQFRRERDKRGQSDKRQQTRLTDEQRRELHRDLDRASREIYGR